MAEFLRMSRRQLATWIAWAERHAASPADADARHALLCAVVESLRYRGQMDPADLLQKFMLAPVNRPEPRRRRRRRRRGKGPARGSADSRRRFAAYGARCQAAAKAAQKRG